MQLNINGQVHNIDVEPNMPLLWAIREVVGLTGTKYGCGVAQCGACTVYMNGEPVRSCSIPVSAVGAAKITTIESLSKDNSHPVQQAWIALDVPQCGYCQSGQVMAAVQHLPLRHISKNSGWHSCCLWSEKISRSIGSVPSYSCNPWLRRTT
jgi:isoquinoline 1-oxidoreductase subunit alpha